MRTISVSLLIFIILFPFATSYAAPVVCPDGNVYNDRCPSSTQTNQTLGRFNPSVTSMAGGGDSFGGMNFSGVGGAVLSCYNVGKSISGGISDLFKKSKNTANTAITAANKIAGGGGGGGGGTEQQVSDPVVREESKKQTENIEKQTQRENCLNGVAYQIAKGMLAQTVQRTVSWISTGFNGNPFYVRDIDSYLYSIRNQKLSNFLQNIPTEDPVFGNAIRSAITQQVTGYTDGRINQLMNTPQAQEYQAFQNDFTKGGWNTFLNPQNNAISAYFNAIDRIGGEINTSQRNTQAELQQGSGFLSMKSCVEWNKDLSYDNITTSCNQKFQTELAAELAACPQTDPIRKSSCVNGVNTKYNTLINSCIRTDASIVAGDTAHCLRYETVTPGSVISAQAAAVTTTHTRQLEQADQINEVLGAFFDSLINRLFTNGLGGLGGSIGNQRGTNVVYNTNGQAIDSINGTSADQAFGYSAITGGFNGEFDISRPQQLRSIIKTQIDFVNRTKDVQAAIKPIIPTLGQLDYCVPGPNPTWKIGTDYNANIILSTVSGQPSSKNQLGNTISSISSAAGPGTVIAAVGNVVGAITQSIFGGNTNPTEITADPLTIFDKTYNSAQKISRLYIKQDGGIGDYKRPMVEELKERYGDLMKVYEKVYDREVIKKVLIAGDQLNSGLNSLSVATANADEILDETGAMIYYNQSLTEISKENSDNIARTEDAILKLQAINAEVQRIVYDAKQRYIRDHPDVNRACLDSAYTVTINPNLTVPEVTGSIVPATGTTRYESDALDPAVLRSQNAEQYFYSHL